MTSKNARAQTLIRLLGYWELKHSRHWVSRIEQIWLNTCANTQWQDPPTPSTNAPSASDMPSSPAEE
ncbi:uncharacterized protein IUM83_02894 [Phytophthora cinnamomi]|uniref:uncharacterized protein n=1 Tax=Phytophthora cinnamomi TaxID=4785 RepID=UPI00355A5460|nr:hypothetical protein IUM83_02894 [Phytophthora cinnamomi]